MPNTKIKRETALEYITLTLAFVKLNVINPSAHLKTSMWFSGRALGIGCKPWHDSHTGKDLQGHIRFLTKSVKNPSSKFDNLYL